MVITAKEQGTNVPQIPKKNNLTITHPKVAAEWHPTKNGALQPDQVTASSDIKIVWMNACGHETVASVRARIKSFNNPNRMCNICRMKLPNVTGIPPMEETLAECFPELAAEWHPTKNGDLTPKQVRPKRKSKVWWRCACGCEWEAPIAARTQGHMCCPQCGHTNHHDKKKSGQCHRTSNIANKYVGKKYPMKSGELIEVIAYHHAKNVDVQFSDGAIRYGVQMAHVMRGNINHPSIMHYRDTQKAQEARLGETRMMNCGVEGVIIAYRNGEDIDVSFDGYIVTNKRYGHFKRGNIAPPMSYWKPLESNTDIDRKNADSNLKHQKISRKKYRKIQCSPNALLLKNRAERVGAIEIARNGLLMEIVEYRNTEDITVEFEDGVRVDTRYCYFKNGTVVHPSKPGKQWGISFPEITILYYLSKLGFKKYSKGYFAKFHSDFGHMELDIFHEQLKYAVEYDGYAFHRTKYVIGNDILKEKLCALSNIRLIKVREKGLPTESHPNAIVRYKHWDNDELQQIIYHIVQDINNHCGTNFELDVDIVRDKVEIIAMFTSYKAQASERIGLTSIATNGMQMQIIDYARSDNLTIEFEDGAIVSGVTYRRFMDGRVAHPSKKSTSRLGETRISKHGESMTIIRYDGTNNIDIQFGNGEILHNTTYQQFVRATLKSSRYKEEERRHFMQSKIGEVSIANNGVKMKIIDYINTNCITVQFATGEIRENVKYQCFRHGSVSPTAKPKTQHPRVGEESIASNGQVMRITTYYNSSNCDIEFEDGTRVQHVTYNLFKQGRVANPNLRTRDVQMQATADSRLNEVHYNKQGEKMTIVGYLNSMQVTVQFDDGVKRDGLTYNAIKKGRVLKPKIA